MDLVAVDNAEAVGWVCFVVGIVLVLLGAIIGVVTSLRDVAGKVDRAKQKIDETTAKLEVASTPGFESTAAAGTAQEASASASAAKSAMEQVQGIVGSLPVNLRFAGMLVLVGAVLMSVATIQFGGVSLF